jgi:hypothetical protein
MYPAHSHTGPQLSVTEYRKLDFYFAIRVTLIIRPNYTRGHKWRSWGCGLTFPGPWKLQHDHGEFWQWSSIFSAFKAKIGVFSPIVVVYKFNLTTFSNQQVATFTEHYKNLSLWFYFILRTILYYFNINTFNFNVEVGGKDFFRKKWLCVFFSESPSQTPGARLHSLHTTN